VTPVTGSDPVHRYHDGTKHHFHRFAPSLGYLDWASQPTPFRSFAGARDIPLAPRPDAHPSTAAIGDLLRHALGLSAWKDNGHARWPLRVNPSSGNLHPTEAYVVLAPLAGVTERAGVYHYAPDRHALEQRCAFDGDPPLLVALTSIHWREAWKYGERAFRYCQHDLGHAIAALGYAAALGGNTLTMDPQWSHGAIAALTGIDRDQDFVDAEREAAECALIVASLKPQVPGRVSSPGELLKAVAVGCWTGRASQLSDDHVQWTFIDEIAQATEDPGRTIAADHPPIQLPNYPITQLPDRRVLLQRRSALAFDGRSSIDGDRFFAMLAATLPAGGPPFDALWWDPRIHLALFVHRVEGLDPGLYLLPRDAAAVARLRAALGREFEWQAVTASLPLVRLARGDCRRLAMRVSCDQDIASDGFFSLGMIADFDASLDAFGPSFYRHLFWESGVVGQALYLAAETAGARATGIGCFYDDPMHDVLGLSGHAFQSLYHFTVGMPVEDPRLTTQTGYEWERLRL